MWSHANTITTFNVCLWGKHCKCIVNMVSYRKRSSIHVCNEPWFWWSPKAPCETDVSHRLMEHRSSRTRAREDARCLHIGDMKPRYNSVIFHLCSCSHRNKNDLIIKRPCDALCFLTQTVSLLSLEHVHLFYICTRRQSQNGREMAHAPVRLTL